MQFGSRLGKMSLGDVLRDTLLRHWDSLASPRVVFVKLTGQWTIRTREGCSRCLLLPFGRPRSGFRGRVLVAEHRVAVAPPRQGDTRTDTRAVGLPWTAPDYVD